MHNHNSQAVESGLVPGMHVTASAGRLCTEAANTVVTFCPPLADRPTTTLPNAVVTVSTHLPPVPTSVTTVSEVPTVPATTVPPTHPETPNEVGGIGLAGATPLEREYLACIAFHESTNRVDEYNAAGPYYGKYQFLQSTWDNFVASIGRPELVGVDIRQVPEPVQDFVALQFLRAGRRGEWGPNRICA